MLLQRRLCISIQRSAAQVPTALSLSWGLALARLLFCFDHHNVSACKKHTPNPNKKWRKIPLQQLSCLLRVSMFPQRNCGASRATPSSSCACVCVAITLLVCFGKLTHITRRQIAATRNTRICSNDECTLTQNVNKFAAIHR